MSQSNTKPAPQPPQPMDYGFSSSFDDLSAVQPSRTAPKAASTKSKPKKSVTKKAKAPPKTSSKPSSQTGIKGKGAAKTKAMSKLAALHQESDTVAKNLGFASREAQPIVLKKRRRTHHDEPVDQLSIRGPVRILNDFINHCETENLSYWEGLEALLQSSKPS